MKKYVFVTVVTLIFTCGGLTACTPTKAVRGNILKDYQISDVQPGLDTQSDILRKLGSPTTKAPFDDKTWYYLGQETEKRGILDPKVKSESIVIVRFDENGTVARIDTVDPHRNEVPYVREKTPTSGNEITVMQQLLGNMGRFNKAEGDGAGK